MAAPLAGPALPDTLAAATQRTAAYDAGFPGLGYLASPRKRLQYLLLAGDLAGFTAALCAALILAGGQPAVAALPALVLALVLGALMLAWGGMAYLAGLYDLGGTEARPRTGLPLAATMAAAAVATVMVLLAAMPAGSALLAAALFAPIAGLGIFALRRGLGMLHAGLGRPQRVLVIVDGAQGEEIARRLRGLMAPDRVTIERISSLTGQAGTRGDGAVPFPAAVAGLLQRGAYDLVAIDASSSALSRAEVEGLIGIRHRGARIVHLPSLYKAVSGKVELAAVSEEWLLHVLAARRAGGRLYARAKRLLDLAVAVPALILLSPLLALIALAIKLDNPGPALFVQERLGQNKRPFRCLKFRSMIPDAEARTGAVWAQKGDPRVTRVGRILRATRLDELPQLLNVVRGEMSLVGPRPIRQHFAERLARTIPYYDLRFLVKPGLTGWSQIMMDAADNEDEQREKFEYELFYLESRSFLLDVYVLWRTARVVFRRVGY